MNANRHFDESIRRETAFGRLSRSESVEETECIDSLARRILDGCHPGVFTTIGCDGRPHPRWMATISFDVFPVVYALTSPHSRKLDDLQNHPEATWLFASDDLSVTFSLSGHATEILDPYKARDVWNAIGDKTRAYFLRFAPSVSVIGTDVDAVECCIPSRDIHVPCDIEALAAALRPRNGKRIPRAG